MTAPIIVTNQSTRVTRAEAIAMVTAAGYQLTHHAAPAFQWNPRPVIYLDNVVHVPPGSAIVRILDTPAPADAGDAGWHTENPDGAIVSEVYAGPSLDAGGHVLTGNGSVSETLSHEILELYGDPLVNLWCQSPNGYEYAYELCDPVQDDTYTVPVGALAVAVSNFVLPEWFDDAPTFAARFDYLGHLKAAFSIGPGGYVAKMRGGAVSYEFGHMRPAHKRSGPRVRRRVAKRELSRLVSLVRGQ